MALAPKTQLSLVTTQRLPGLEKFPEAERAILAALNGARLDLLRAAGRPVATNLKTSDYQAREEEYIRAAPGSSGMTLLLPKATRENLAARVTVLLESVANADLTVQAISGTVNTASSLTLGAVGRVDFLSNGETGWFSERSIAGSTSIVESGGEYQLAAGTGDVTWAQNSTATTIANDAVTNAKAANMAAATIKGRALGAGAGDPTDLTAAQVLDIIEPSAAVWTADHDFQAECKVDELFVDEQATSPSVSAGRGMFWVRNDAPSLPMFTGDTNVDVPLKQVHTQKTAATTVSAATTVLATTDTFTVPANTLAVGSRFRCTYAYQFVRGATATALNLSSFFDVGSFPSTAIAAQTAAGTYELRVEAELTILSTGGSGTAMGVITTYGTASTVTGSISAASTVSLTIDTTAALAMRGAAQMSAAVANTSITALGGHIEWLA